MSVKVTINCGCGKWNSVSVGEMQNLKQLLTDATKTVRDHHDAFGHGMTIVVLVDRDDEKYWNIRLAEEKRLELSRNEDV